jgi:hypothetical protein
LEVQKNRFLEDFRIFSYLDEMSFLHPDIIFCCITYLILIGIMFWSKRNNRPDDSDNDGEGGLPIENGPKLDLPPGVCLPGEGPSIVREQYDEVLG